MTDDPPYLKLKRPVESADPPGADLPSSDTLIAGCHLIMVLSRVELARLDAARVRQALAGSKTSTLSDWLWMMKGFDIGVRLRKSRPPGGVDLDEPPDRLILEDKKDIGILAEREEDAILAMEDCGLVAFDDAGVMSVTEKGLVFCGLSKVYSGLETSREGGER